ncbi:MAG TPA: PRC-barrel domain-containing protein [Thermoanaerobaculia bacterium]|nr:PRC-barrel domain-containing protein [Thermoanaerobaculia bacterium]
MANTTATQPQVLSATSLMGDDVYSPQGEKLGDIKELMIDLEHGRVAYAVLSFGGFIGLGEKLFAIPFSSLTLLPEKEHFVLEVPKERLEKAPGFDKDNWPTISDRTWGAEIHRYYGVSPYWDVR